MPALSDLLQRLRAAPAIVRGGLWMVAASACFTVVTGIIRHLSGSVEVFEIIFFRNFFGLVALAPWFWRHGLGGLRTRRLGLYGLRGVTGLINMSCWYYAITVIALADVMALSFTAPLFATLAAVVILRERVRAGRWGATLAGFAGALLILRPGGDLEPAALLMLVSAAFMALSVIIIKTLSRTESAGAIVAWMCLILTPASLLPALFVWRWPDAQELAWLATLGTFATIGHYCFTRALGSTEASAVLPFDFIRLPFAALLGYLAFGERADIWTWAGGLVIFSSALYVGHSEARAAIGKAPPESAGLGGGAP